MTILDSLLRRLPSRTQTQPSAPPAQQVHTLALETTPTLTGDLLEFSDLLLTLALDQRLVQLPDGRWRLDVTAQHMQVAVLVFTPDGLIETAKAWRTIPTNRVNVLAAEMLAHDGTRAVLDSSSADLWSDVRRVLTDLASTLPSAAA